MVIVDQEKAKIDDVLARAGYVPGSSGYIKNYQRAVGKVIKTLTVENMEWAEKTAKEWNDTHPPPRDPSKVRLLSRGSMVLKLQIEPRKEKVGSLPTNFQRKCGNNVAPEWL